MVVATLCRPVNASTVGRAIPPDEPADRPALLSEGRDDTANWCEAIETLLQLRLLEDDWDGLGAPAPSTALVDSALSLAQILRQQRFPPPCRVVAGLTGTVLFEWQSAGGGYFEVEMTQPRQVEWVLMVLGQQTTSGQQAW